MRLYGGSNDRDNSPKVNTGDLDDLRYQPLHVSDACMKELTDIAGRMQAPHPLNDKTVQERLSALRGGTRLKGRDRKECALLIGFTKNHPHRDDITIIQSKLNAQEHVASIPLTHAMLERLGMAERAEDDNVLLVVGSKNEMGAALEEAVEVILTEKSKQPKSEKEQKLLFQQIQQCAHEVRLAVTAAIGEAIEEFWRNNPPPYDDKAVAQR